MTYPGKRIETELYEDQVPPHAPGVEGNVPPEVDDQIDHGTSADAYPPPAETPVEALLAALAVEVPATETTAPADQ